MTTAAASRAEAHLWLLLEEALVAAGRGGADVWEVQRHFRYVSDALLAAGVVAPPIAGRLRYELDDALVVRGLLPPASFSGLGAIDPETGTADDEDDAGGAVADDGSVWLEAELERHLDLLAGYDPTSHPTAGAEAMRILAGPVRALEAAGALGAAKPLVADFAASIGAAGFDPGPSAPTGRVRREWVRFLRDRPAPWADHPQPTLTLHPARANLGELRGRTVRVDEVAWAPDELQVHVTLRRVGPVAGGFLDPDERTAWSLRAIDDRGRLHLGQPVPPVAEAGGGARFRLRPGLAEGVGQLDLRLTARGARIEGQVQL